MELRDIIQTFEKIIIIAEQHFPYDLPNGECERSLVEARAAIQELEGGCLRVLEPWRPISTAPRDGTRIIACYNLNFGPFTASFKDCVWWDVSGDGIVNPTHWLPIGVLPTPPLDFT